MTINSSKPWLTVSSFVSDKGVVDRAETTFDEFLENETVQAQVKESSDAIFNIFKLVNYLPAFFTFFMAVSPLILAFFTTFSYLLQTFFTSIAYYKSIPNKQP